jgi:hypothetical protein
MPCVAGWREVVVLKTERLSFVELSERLGQYERKYNLSTVEFYRRFHEGGMGDDDDLMLWAGLYHLYLTSLPIRQPARSEAVSA